MISVSPSVGDVVWDVFDGASFGFWAISHSDFLPDTPMRIELEVSAALVMISLLYLLDHPDKIGTLEADRVAPTTEWSVEAYGKDARAYNTVIVCSASYSSLTELFSEHPQRAPESAKNTLTRRCHSARHSNSFLHSTLKIRKAPKTVKPAHTETSLRHADRLCF